MRLLLLLLLLLRVGVPFTIRSLSIGPKMNADDGFFLCAVAVVVVVAVCMWPASYKGGAEGNGSNPRLGGSNGLCRYIARSRFGTFFLAFFR